MRSKRLYLKIDLSKYMHSAVTCSGGKHNITENDKTATLNKIEVCNIPQGSIIIKLDDIKVQNLISDSVKLGHNKHGDFAIITDTHIICVEMKSKKKVDGNLAGECISKFSSDLCSLFYADKIFEVMAKKNNYFEKMKMRYVLLYQGGGINKTPTVNSVKTQSPNDTPDNFRKMAVVNNDIIDFNLLI